MVLIPAVQILKISSSVLDTSDCRRSAVLNLFTPGHPHEEDHPKVFTDGFHMFFQRLLFIIIYYKKTIDLIVK